MNALTWRQDLHLLGMVDVTYPAGIPPYDYSINTWTGSNLTQIGYKQGGASGVTVATVTMTYDGSGNLLTYTRVLG